MNICSMPPEVILQIEADKQVCFWLNEKRAGRMAKDAIERKIGLMDHDSITRYRAALSKYGKIFLMNKELK